MITTTSPQQTFFLGRQPILDIRQEIVGYELLFRSSEKNMSEFDSQEQACTSVIASALADFGFREILGDKLGFINVTYDVLLSDLIEILPREQTILELLESVSFDCAVRERCQQLKSKNYRIALDDHVYNPEHAELYRFVDIVKLDIMELPASVLPEMITGLRRFPVRILAEKVETAEQFQDCLKLGFTLFQGYFFARPTVLKCRGLEPSKIVMLRLLRCLHEEAELNEIEDIFRTAPELTYNLLKLVNSVHIGMREKIKSLRHAIVILGTDKLRRWVQLAIFASTDSRGINSPLLEMAAVRGRLMEYLVMEQHNLSRGNEKVEAAFMTGILSLVGVLFDSTIEEIINELCLSDEIVAALLSRQGELGDLLALAETIEQTNFKKVHDIIGSSEIPIARLLSAQLDAYNWRASITATKS
ncbi:MAG TPA: EAL domain-containing protein [Desulfuromonadaceae bacterium]|jgi:EAL and modified HD-GYP domain-containing signal transduction protein